MIHAEDRHELLAIEDLRHHVPEDHGTELTDVAERGDVEDWFDRSGIESTGDHDLDVLHMWHEEAHRRDEAIRRVTIPVTFDVTIDLTAIGLGGFRTEWVSAEADGLRFGLDSGAGLGNRFMEASIHGKRGDVYARTDIGDLAQALWNEMRNDLTEDAGGGVAGGQPPGGEPAQDG